MRPSKFAAVPAITACTRSPSASASSSRLSTSIPPPSARTYPSARAENVWQRPVGDVIDACAAPIEKPGLRRMLTPPARPSRVRPDASIAHTSWMAVSDAEHAVSTVML